MRATLAGAAAAATAALAARRHLRMRPALAGVAPELRSPLLPYVTVTYRARTLPFLRAVYRIKRPAGPGVTVTSHRVGAAGMRVLVATPRRARRPGPAVLMLHGGGMIVGSALLELSTYGRLARELDAVIVAPDYRLAPENPFPAALDDCMATLSWMRERAVTLGIDPDRIAVAGFSAGGGLAAAVAQRCHDEGLGLRAQALVYPMLDDRTVLRDSGGRGRLVWTPESNRFAWTAYLGRAPRMTDAPPYAAPARRANLSGLAPAWIGVGDLDLFYAEDLAYAHTLRACGVPCELLTVAGMYHAADGYAPRSAVAAAFMSSLRDHLRTYL
ncbi:alpha/beta hydrolase [Mycobacterium sp. UM_Kg1]|uniref:alpha/beta hydrolase n=1 Tax=Mycobacterium sp. UM_Kg1 TaxID=1545691 RepID=UPI00061AA0A6|nr:alpha/beta hydrolase [Mycobacterium sp. UM_Kg1]